MILLTTSRRYPLFSILIAYTLPLILHTFFHQTALALTGINKVALGSFFYASALYSITSLVLLSFLFSHHAMTLSPNAAPMWLWATPSTLDAYLAHCYHARPSNQCLKLYFHAPTSIRFLLCFLTLSATCTALSALYSAPSSAASILQLCWYLGLCKTCQNTFFTPSHPTAQPSNLSSVPLSQEAVPKPTSPRNTLRTPLCHQPKILQSVLSRFARAL